MTGRGIGHQDKHASGRMSTRGHSEGVNKHPRNDTTSGDAVVSGCSFSRNEEERGTL